MKKFNILEHFVLEGINTESLRHRGDIIPPSKALCLPISVFHKSKLYTPAVLER